MAILGTQKTIDDKHQHFAIYTYIDHPLVEKGLDTVHHVFHQGSSISDASLLMASGRGPGSGHWEREHGDVPNVPQATPRTFALGDSSLVVENP